VAQYRTGQYEAAIETLHQAMALESGLPYDFIFLSMAYGKLGNFEKSRDWYEKAVRWEEETGKYAPEIHVYRQEAAELLQLNEQSKPNRDAPTPSA
jgi:tetratricopeptide (TPR) repeat protein